MKYYSTELHCHTLHSDGKLTVKELVDELKNIGVKIASITDHNTDSAFKEIECENDIFILKGIEWSTFYGHILVVGCKKYIDWRCANTYNIDKYLKEIKLNDGLVGIAHPFLLGDPLYPGCYMEFNIKKWENVDYIEVWSSDFPANENKNIKAYKLWHEKLIEGHRLSAFSGRDIHSIQPETRNYASNYIGVEGGINENSIKNAIKSGRVYVSLGPEIEFRICQGGMKYNLGDTVKEEKLKITVDINERLEIVDRFKIKCKNIKVINNGRCILDTLDRNIEILPKEGYIILEFYGEHNGRENSLIAFSSPIYIR